MNKTVDIDLVDLVEIMESFVKKLDKLPLEDKIDLAARLKPVAKACDVIDKDVKDIIKTKLKHQEGVRLGTLFKAVLKLVHVSRLDQAAFKKDHLDIYEAYLKDNTDERITFELR